MMRYRLALLGFICLPLWLSGGSINAQQPHQFENSRYLQRDDIVSSESAFLRAPNYAGWPVGRVMYKSIPDGFVPRRPAWADASTTLTQATFEVTTCTIGGKWPGSLVVMRRVE